MDAILQSFDSQVPSEIKVKVEPSDSSSNNSRSITECNATSPKTTGNHAFNNPMFVHKHNDKLNIRFIGYGPTVVSGASNLQPSTDSVESNLLVVGALTEVNKSLNLMTATLQNLVNESVSSKDHSDDYTPPPKVHLTQNHMYGNDLQSTYSYERESNHLSDNGLRSPSRLRSRGMGHRTYVEEHFSPRTHRRTSTHEDLFSPRRATRRDTSPHRRETNNHHARPHQQQPTRSRPYFMMMGSPIFQREWSAEQHEQFRVALSKLAVNSKITKVDINSPNHQYCSNNAQLLLLEVYLFTVFGIKDFVTLLLNNPDMEVTEDFDYSLALVLTKISNAQNEKLQGIYFIN